MAASNYSDEFRWGVFPNKGNLDEATSYRISHTYPNERMERRLPCQKDQSFEPSPTISRCHADQSQTVSNIKSLESTLVHKGH